MKKSQIKIWVWVAVILLPCMVYAAQGPEPRIAIDDPVYIFESIPEGSHVSHVFKLKNTSDVPVRILKVQPP